jgi:hypothetical protein
MKDNIKEGWRWWMDGTGSGSCTMTRFGNIIVKPSVSVIAVLHFSVQFVFRTCELAASTNLRNSTPGSSKLKPM